MFVRSNPESVIIFKKIVIVTAHWRVYYSALFSHAGTTTTTTISNVIFMVAGLITVPAVDRGRYTIKHFWARQDNEEESSLGPKNTKPVR